MDNSEDPVKIVFIYTLFKAIEMLSEKLHLTFACVIPSKLSKYHRKRDAQRKSQYMRKYIITVSILFPCDSTFLKKKYTSISQHYSNWRFSTNLIIIQRCKFIFTLFSKDRVQSTRWNIFPSSLYTGCTIAKVQILSTIWHTKITNLKNKNILWFIEKSYTVRIKDPRLH